MVFDRMGIDTNEVVDGMNTKWNALGFRPGLVGGHCIGVDPYYFTYEAEKLGYPLYKAYFYTPIRKAKRLGNRLREYFSANQHK